MFIRTVLIVAALLLALCSRSHAVHPHDEHAWSDEEKEVLRSLWIGSLPSLPVDPSNKYSDNPKAAALGKMIFFDKRFSADGTVSCGTCHQPERNFEDGLPLAHGIGTTTRRTMPLAGVAYSPWFFWDGRVDSLWAQALQPPEAPLEHGITRTRCAVIVGRHYREDYGKVFGPLHEFTEEEYPILAKPAPEDPGAYRAWQSMSPEKRARVNEVYVNMGKAIAAYVRLIQHGPSRFDRYLMALFGGDAKKMKEALSKDEVAGLVLFIGKAKCINCHNGPLLTNNDFHNLAVPQPPNLPDDRGRAEGIRKVRADLFNCLSRYSDARPKDCVELRFMDTRVEKYVGAFKTPSLRNVAERPPYMHAGQFGALQEVLEHYREVSGSPGKAADLEHADLTDDELRRIEAFLHALTGPIISP
jgi:cytochrome c peroxidase